MDLFQVRRGFFEVMMADNPFRVPVPGNRSGDVCLQINVLDTRSDRRTQDRLPLFFAAPPATAIALAAAGDQGGRRALFQQPRHVGRPRQPVQSQFHQRCAFFCQSLMLQNHHLVPGPPDADTNCTQRSMPHPPPGAPAGVVLFPVARPRLQEPRFSECQLHHSIIPICQTVDRGPTGSRPRRSDVREDNGAHRRSDAVAQADSESPRDSAAVPI